MVRKVRIGDRNEIDLALWGTERVEYSKARHGRLERGAALGECALVAAMTQAMTIRSAPAAVTTETPAADEAAA